MNAGSEAVRSNGPLHSPRMAGRKRRGAGWLLATAGVIVAALWVASGWVWWLQITTQRSYTMCARGHLRVLTGSSRDEPPANRGWRFERVDRSSSYAGWKWGVGENDRHTWHVGVAKYGSSYDSLGYGESEFVIALWPIPLLLWTPAALLLRSGILARRRAITGKCKACGYDLAGLAAGSPCPECGTVHSEAERMNAGSEAERTNGPHQSTDESNT